MEHLTREVFERMVKSIPTTYRYSRPAPVPLSIVDLFYSPLRLGYGDETYEHHNAKHWLLRNLDLWYRKC